MVTLPEQVMLPLEILTPESTTVFPSGMVTLDVAVIL